jgi:hypothetical protein
MWTLRGAQYVVLSEGRSKGGEINQLKSQEVGGNSTCYTTSYDKGKADIIWYEYFVLNLGTVQAVRSVCSAPNAATPVVRVCTLSVLTAGQSIVTSRARTVVPDVSKIVSPSSRAHSPWRKGSSTSEDKGDMYLRNVWSHVHTCVAT